MPLREIYKIISAWQTCNIASLASHQPQTFYHLLCMYQTHRGGKVSVFLTVRSGLSLSQWLTARMTPDLQSHRVMSPISGGWSPLTQRNRFPTSSGRASTAMALGWSNPPSKTLPNNALTALSFTTLNQL